MWSEEKLPFFSKPRAGLYHLKPKVDVSNQGRDTVTDENVVVVEQGSLEAQRIAKAMSSPTSADLFNALSEVPMSATALAERTELPLTTVKYHLENMLAAGLIEVSDTRWSTKGREMKIYAVKDQVVLIAPKKKVNVRGIMERYGVAAGAFAVICALGLAIPSTLLQMMPGGTAPLPGMEMKSMTGALSAPPMMNEAPEAASAQVTAVYDTGAGIVSTMPSWIHEAVMVFFVAGVVILGMMMVYELYSLRRGI